MLEQQLIRQGGSTERKLLKEKLARLLEAFPVGVLGLEADTSISVIDPCAVHLLGISKEKALGRRLGDTALPCRRCRAIPENPRKPCTRMVVTGKASTNRLTVLWSCVPLGEEEGNGCVVGLFDTTVQERLTEKVLRAKEEMEVIFDSVTDPTFVVDRHYRIQRANRACSQLSGREFKELIGVSCREAIGVEEGFCKDCPLPEIFNTGRAAVAEQTLPSGRTWLINYFPIATHHGIEGVVVRYHDRTEQKRIEAKLIQAEKLAAVGQLVAGVAHEINNPSAYVLSNLNRLGELAGEVKRFAENAQLALAEGGGDPQSALAEVGRGLEELKKLGGLDELPELVGDSLEGMARIQKIVNDLKLFSHKGSDARELVDLNECIDSALNIVWNQLKYKCEVRKELGLLPKVSCNRQRVGQTLMNLLVNASQAIEKRGRITLRSWAAEGFAFVEISDNGMGIPGENLERIFQPFFTTKAEGQGTGLGLHLVRKFICESGGEIHVASVPGEGATFTIRLPLSASTGEDGITTPPGGG